MIRKIIYGFIIALLLGLVVFLYLRLDDKKPVEEKDLVYKLIPSDAAFILNSGNATKFFHKIHHENLVWQELRDFPLFMSSTTILSKFDSLLSSEMDIEMNVKGSSFCFSLHPKGDSEFTPLFIFEFSSEIKKEAGENIVKRLYGKNILFKEKAYNDFNIRSVTDTSGTLIGAYYHFENRMVWSPSDLLLEKSIGELSIEGGVGGSPDFKNILLTAGKNVTANLFVNFKQLAKVTGSWLNEAHFLDGKAVSKWGSWAALDFHPEGHSVLLDGFMNYGEADEFTVRFKNQEPMAFSSIGIMPQSTRYFHCMGISDLNTYLLYYPTNVNEKKKLDLWSEQWEETYGERPLNVLQNLLGDEISKVSTLNKPKASEYLIAKLKSNTTAQEFFSDFLSVFAEKNGKRISAYQKQLKVDDATTYDYYNFPINVLFAQYFGPLFKVSDLNFFVLYDNYLIMAKSAGDLKEFLYQNLLGQTLVENQYFADFEKNLGARSNFQFYLDCRNADVAIENMFAPEFIKEKLKTPERLKNLNALGFQLVNSKEKIYTNMYLDYAGERKEEAQTLWKSLLDTTFIKKPTMVENHYTHEKEICIQDQKHNLYLISPSGRIIWKKPLTEPILGRIYQIDKFKNGKLQLLFNTASKLHMLDRNGNYLNRYPLSLSSKATGGLGLMDYDKTRDYRIFVPCMDKSVQLFDKDGNKLKGWKFKGADYPVNSRINHFRVDVKDFIVFSDQSRIYLLNRQGQVRLRLKEQFSKSPKSLINFDSNGPKGEPCLVTTSTDGEIKYIYFNGEVETSKVGINKKNHAFIYEDLDGDRREELIFLEDKKLSVFNQNLTRLFEHKFDRDISYLPYVYHFSARDKKIGIIDKRERNIYLFNSDGSITNGFPLRGNTPFTLGFLKNEAKSFNLLVGGEGNFLYNYRVK